MFEKKISSNNIEIIKNSNDFFVGTRFSRDGQVWTVKEAFVEDNTEMRRIIAEDGTDEIMTLVTLKKDAKDVEIIEKES